MQAKISLLCIQLLCALSLLSMCMEFNVFWIPILCTTLFAGRWKTLSILGETSECPSIQVPAGAYIDFPEEFFDGDDPGPITPAVGQRGGRGGGRLRLGQSATISSQSQAALLHKVQGPNWTEPEMLVLISQKRIEWEWHTSNQPSLAKFVYGTTTWRAVLAGCMSVVGFRARDTDQITNKWVGLIKDYKKLKDYLESSGSANWWEMSREEKKELSKTSKMLLEFSEAMFKEMEGFVGKRQIFGRVADVVDTDRVAPPVPKQFHRSTSPSREPSCVGVGSPLMQGLEQIWEMNMNALQTWNLLPNKWHFDCSWVFPLARRFLWLREASA